MWKCASKGIKATLKKGVLRCNTVLSTKPQQEKEFNCLLKFAPVFIEHFNRYYGFYKNTCGNFSNDQKDKEGPKKRNSFLENFDNNVFDALRWSGVFVLGYYFLQPFTRKKLSPSFNYYENHACPTLIGYQKTLQYLIQSVGVKPYNCVLPEVNAAKCKESGNHNKTFDISKFQEETFNSLEKAHQKVAGTLNNWIGTQCMHTGRHKEALKFFSQAAEVQNPAGIFNLGICHERGLGTSQNITRAAELYRKAADLGHPSAMYNLGVFYAQGLGGVELDVNHARELFKAAATLGQTDAVKALNLNQESEEKLPDKVLSNNITEKKSEIFENSLDCNNALCKSSSESFKICDYGMRNANCYSFDCSDRKEISSSLDSDSGVLVLDLSPHNEPEVVPV